MLARIGRAAESVLGREDRPDIEAPRMEQVDQVDPPRGIGRNGPTARSTTPGSSATEVWLASTATRRPASSGK